LTDRKREGPLAYLVALVAVALGYEWGVSHILRVHREAGRVKCLGRAAPGRPVARTD